MLQFSQVQGSVLVDDRVNQYSQMAWSGMQLPDQGDYVIATDQGARATVVVNGKAVTVPPSSFAHIHQQKTGVYNHRESFHNVKTVLGKLWAHIDQNPHDQGNAGGGGIRG